MNTLAAVSGASNQHRSTCGGRLHDESFSLERQEQGRAGEAPCGEG